MEDNMKAIKKFLCAFLSLVLLISVSNAVGEIAEVPFSGKIVVESLEYPVDLSTIDIKVYQSTPREATISEWLVEYDETYSFSVHPNKEGVFEFTPPSQVFSITIQIDTLPEGFGIDKHTELYFNRVNSQKVFTLSPIDRAMLNIDNPAGEPSITLLNHDGKEVYAYYEFEPVYSAESPASNFVEVTGTVKMNGGIEFTPSATIDLSGVDPMVKLNQLCNFGIISGEMAVEEYRRILESVNTSDCCYLPTVTDNSTAVYGIPNVPESVQVSMNSLTSEVHNNCFKVHYDESDTTKAEAQAIADFLLAMESKRISAGFKAPIPYSSDNQFNVYVFAGSCPDSAYSNARGITYPTGSGTSIITIWKFSTLSAEEKETVAHEYFHTVQYAYNADWTPMWFLDATAGWFAARYSGSIKRVQAHYNTYFAYCSKSIYTDEETLSLRYGATVFPQVIDVEYGGPTTIRKIFSRIDSIQPKDEISLEDCITWGIQQYDKSGSFSEAFKKLGVYITLPGYFYRSVIPKMTVWNNNYMVNASASTVSASKTVDLETFGLQPYHFKAEYNDALYLSVVVDFARPANCAVGIVTRTSSAVVNSSITDVAKDRYSVVISPFAKEPVLGSNNVANVYVSPIFTGRNPGRCRATISYSLSYFPSN